VEIQTLQSRTPVLQGTFDVLVVPGGTDSLKQDVGNVAIQSPLQLFKKLTTILTTLYTLKHSVLPLRTILELKIKLYIGKI
jgi:hypothetical protein